MDSSLEIRKLLPSHVRELASILETHDLWKRLMSIIPKTLEKTNYKCDLTPQNQHKYISRHFSLIENESKKSKRTCTEILFDEWGTSGRVRPALGHLLYLLTKANLYRAADYVAVNLLQQEKPCRPDVGPEAEITVDLSQLIKEKEKDEEIEKILDNVNYVAEAVTLIRTHSNKIPKKDNNIPKIVITPDEEEINSTIESNTPKEISDMIEFSNTDNPVDVNIPNLSLIMKSNGEITNGNSDVTNSISNSYSQTTNSSDYSYNDTYNPAFSQILDSTVRVDGEIKENIPNLPILNNSITTDENIQNNRYELSDSVLPDFTVLHQQSDIPSNIPDLSMLQVNNLATQNSNSTNFSLETNSKNRSCSSPLPNLSLDTVLPHYCYQNLEISTNNFNDGIYRGHNFEGRLLGSGEFGTVYLATDLLNEPVAVKKLHIGDVEIVNVDDEVTKQFRYEVEVLSKYKHENLLSILGYSCDGSTYCLLYEYIPGGALRDRLQNAPNELSWKSRLNIAMGTSKAISYLHSAFPTPLIHRDIKSANILLDNNNQPKLGDFGLIKLIPNQKNNTATTVFGTSAYMPREAFAGDISVKLDTFSFGVVLLELLTSLPPIGNGEDGADLVTYVGETIEGDDISNLVDYKAGCWTEGAINYAKNFYKIAQSCLEEKHRRPTMLQVKVLLDDLIKNIDLW
ncbi:interleukin-1 receptor-associated kinase 4-like [Diorhabda carinulata]|uniref:interleukin-1 receptor-associated kinase 4-like n=1 Tax=Diorhabda carinulata TaxID=1163345 RepID=UPI0025A2C7B6|nr:interleukin-1 receptor-associated kinase 4-like [Diorhabda carinulata]